MRLVKVAPGLVVGVVMLLNQSLRADFFVSVQDATNNYMQGPVDNNQSIILNLDNTQFTVTPTDTTSATNPPFSMSASITVVTGTNGNGPFTISVVDFNHFTPASPLGQGTVTGLISTGASFASGASVDNMATYSTSEPVSTDVTSSVTMANSSASATANIPAVANQFTLFEEMDFTGIGSSGTYAFTASATVNLVPEPTGVVMGLLGIPCLSVVVYFTRRRSVRI